MRLTRDCWLISITCAQCSENFKKARISPNTYMITSGYVNYSYKFNINCIEIKAKYEIFSFTEGSRVKCGVSPTLYSRTLRRSEYVIVRSAFKLGLLGL